MMAHHKDKAVSVTTQNPVVLKMSIDQRRQM